MSYWASLNLSLLIRTVPIPVPPGCEDQRSTTWALSAQQAVTVPTAAHPIQYLAGHSLFPKGIAAMSKITPVRKRWYQSLQRWAGPQAGLKPLALLTAQTTGPSRMGCVSTELCPPEDVCSHYLSTVPLYRGTPSRIQAQCQKAWWGVREPKHQMSIPVGSGNSSLWREEVHSLSPAKRYKGEDKCLSLDWLINQSKEAQRQRGRRSTSFAQECVCKMPTSVTVGPVGKTWDKLQSQELILDFTHLWPPPLFSQCQHYIQTCLTSF